MRVAILGAGQLGIYLTQRLSQEHDICIVDLDKEKLGFISSAFDVQTVCGDITRPNIMIEANLKDCDMVIAVTSSDATNLSICDMSHKLFKTPYKVARIKEDEFTRFPKLLDHVDLIIKSFGETTKQLEQLIFLPGAYFISNFFDSRIQLVGVKISKESDLINYSIKDIYLGLGNIRIKIVSVTRNEIELDMNDKSVTIEPEDKVLFLSEKAYSSQLLSIFQPKKTNVRKIFIAGANHASVTLAKSLENKGYIVKIIDPSADKCKYALNELSKTTVLQYSPVNNNLLVSEGIDEADMFFALTNSDEVNIMSSILAKKLGAKKSIVTINTAEYHSIIKDLSLIDLSMSPHNFSYTTIRAFMTQADILKMYEIEYSNKYVLELKVHGKENVSTVVGKTINEIDIFNDIHILAVMRDNIPMLYLDDLILEDEDRILIQTDDVTSLDNVEKLFQVMPLYIS